MSEASGNVSRRELLVGAGLAAAGLNAQTAHHAHHAVAESKAQGPYKPACFQPHEYATLEVLADLVVPGARGAGAPEFIDFLSSRNAELAAIFTGGLAWLDAEMRRRYGHNFAAAEAGHRSAMLDLIAWRRNDSPELGAGIRFFDWARKMIVDAYYTSKAGIEELGFQGNGAMAEFQVPAEAVQYALKRSGLG